MDLQQALQVFEGVMPDDGSFVLYDNLYGQLMTSNEGRAAVKHFHPLRRQKLIAIKLETDDNGKSLMFVARQLGGE